MPILVTLSPPSIPRFLEHIRSANPPTTVTNQYLKSVGFKSSNDSALIPIFKGIGFLDQSKAPTDVWRNYRGDRTEAKKSLGKGIKDCYSDLYAIYPDAHRGAH